MATTSSFVLVSDGAVVVSGTKADCLAEQANYSDSKLMTSGQFQLAQKLAVKNQALAEINPDQVKPAADPDMDWIRSQMRTYDRSTNRDAWLIRAVQAVAEEVAFWKDGETLEPRLNIHTVSQAWIESGFDAGKRPTNNQARAFIGTVLYFQKKGRLPGKGELANI